MINKGFFEYRIDAIPKNSQREFFVFLKTFVTLHI